MSETAQNSTAAEGNCGAVARPRCTQELSQLMHMQSRIHSVRFAAGRTMRHSNWGEQAHGSFDEGQHLSATRTACAAAARAAQPAGREMNAGPGSLPATDRAAPGRLRRHPPLHQPLLCRQRRRAGLRQRQPERGCARICRSRSLAAPLHEGSGTDLRVSTVGCLRLSDPDICLLYPSRSCPRAAVIPQQDITRNSGHAARAAYGR